MGIDTKWLANRIEELTKERDEAWKRAAYAEKMWGESEAKLSESEALLAKAVDGLRFYAEGEWLEDYPGGVLYAAGDDTSEFKTHLDYGDKARSTIAELNKERSDEKGQDDE